MWVLVGGEKDTGVPSAANPPVLSISIYEKRGTRMKRHSWTGTSEKGG